MEQVPVKVDKSKGKKNKSKGKTIDEETKHMRILKVLIAKVFGFPLAKRHLKNPKRE